jgi:hypothetical protein
LPDHLPGPCTLAGPAADITDLYAFPSPEHPGHVSLVLGVAPLAPADACFSRDVLYRFRLRPVTIGGWQARTSFPLEPEEDEIVVTCSFDPPRVGQEGTCTTSDGKSARFVVGTEAGGRADGLRVFAGRRSHPFGARGPNLLSIVVQIDCVPWLLQGKGPLFAVAAETVAAGGLPIRINRMGRPEIKDTILSMKEFDEVNRNLEVRDLYNLEDPFHMSRDYRDVYRARLNANLPVFDRIDGTIDWLISPGGEHPLTDLLLADHLVVDVTKPYAADTFFEIERATLEGRAHRTCGGRSLNDDVTETLFSLYVCGLSGRRLNPGVQRATVPASNWFPYLAPAGEPQGAGGFTRASSA